MSKHKPGPWTIDTKPLGNMAPLMVAEIESEDSIVCSIWDNNETEMSQANARLIAAAPDMYELLLEIWEEIGLPQPLLGKYYQIFNALNPTA